MVHLLVAEQEKGRAECLLAGRLPLMDWNQQRSAENDLWAARSRAECEWTEGWMGGVMFAMGKEKLIVNLLALNQ